MKKKPVALLAADEPLALDWQERLNRKTPESWSFIVSQTSQPAWIGTVDAICIFTSERPEVVSRWLGDIAGHAASIDRKPPPVLVLAPPEVEAQIVQMAYSSSWDYRLLPDLSEEAIFFALRRLTQEAEEQRAAARCRQRLQQRDEDLEYLAHIVAHDVKAPLRIAAKFLELLTLRHLEKLDESAREYVNLAIANAGKAQRMIDDLRAWSRITWHDDALIEVELAELMREVLAERQSEFDAAGATVDLEPLPCVVGNQEQLRQLFRQVIDNALRFRREGLHLRICSDRDDGQYIITIEDNGRGLEPDMCRFAFELFQRFHAEQGSGNGSGLAFCKRIAELHGGRVWLDSIPDRGTTFYLVLPIHQAGERRR